MENTPIIAVYTDCFWQLNLNFCLKGYVLDRKPGPSPTPTGCEALLHVNRIFLARDAMTTSTLQRPSPGPGYPPRPMDRLGLGDQWLCHSLLSWPLGWDQLPGHPQLCRRDPWAVLLIWTQAIWGRHRKVACLAQRWRGCVLGQSHGAAD